MKIFSKILGVVLVIMSFAMSASAQAELSAVKSNKRNVVVISDRVEQANLKYLVFPEVSEMIAADVINNLNVQGFVSAPSLSSVRERLGKSDIVRHADKLVRDYRYTYNLDFNALKKVAKSLNADDILIVTGGMDTVSNFLKPTWYFFLNIPGENMVKSEYKLYTHFALIDVQNETVKWQNTYHRQITSPEFALANATYAPDYRQMSKIKKGSEVIARDASYRVECILAPELAMTKQPPTRHERMKYKIDKMQNEHIQNVNFKNQQKNEKAQEKHIKTSEKSVTEEINAVNLQPKQDEVSPAANSVQISPINIIIPKM